MNSCTWQASSTPPLTAAAPASASSPPNRHTPTRSQPLPSAENTVIPTLPLSLRKGNKPITNSLISSGGLPQFNPTSSPDLDALLSTFRTNIFLPSHLLRLQRNLLYKPKNHFLLTSDEPATVRVGNEVLQLQPLNHLRDEPPTRQSFAKILALMQEGRDWQNLPGFLEGLKTAKRKLHPWQIEKMVRRANLAGRQGVVLECLRRVEGTGVGLWDPEVVSEIMRGAVMKALQGSWSPEAVEKANKFARDVWDLLHDPRHASQSRAQRTRPEIIGILVQLEASYTLLSLPKADDTGKLQSAVELLLSNWDKKALILEDTAMTSPTANQILMTWAPVWHGMTLARKALGESSKHGKLLEEKLTQDLQPMLERAGEVVTADEDLPQRGRRGMRMWEDLKGIEI